ncbi:MAG: outer membrane lipoprotein carrier protein LolA [Deltaproteobacteria bacterium]|jgi:hypothetical protein|nr:outer membrane lipoprotein carrier protein LolA [Deltaproteobacteria bacterium]
MITPLLSTWRKDAFLRQSAALLLFLIACLLPPFACAAEPLLADASILDALRAKAASVQSIRSDFVQKTHIPMFTNPMQSRGRFMFMRPDALLWEYTEPMAEGFILSGGKGFQWDEGRQSHKPFNPENDPIAAIIARQLVAWITFDTNMIGKEYAIEPTNREPLRLKMTPLRQDIASVIESITITFTPEGPASLVELRERRGGATTIAFTRTMVNVPLDAAAFQQP